MKSFLGVRYLAFASSAAAWHTAPPVSPSSVWNIKHTTNNSAKFGTRTRSSSKQQGSRQCVGTTVGVQAAHTSGVEGARRETGGVKVIYDDFFLKHRPPRGHDHPECPERVSTAKAELENLEGLAWATPSSLSSEDGKAATVGAIERVHKKEYLDEIRGICKKGGGGADFDTYVCPDTFEVCIAATSAWMDAAESALEGSPAFALTRPPGHHATSGVAMGFCIVCFAAVSAFHALETLGCRRVAMLDFDVHHGNGIAALVKGDDRIRYCSIHQGGIFPGSGGAEDAGPLGTLKHLPFFGLGETWDTYEARFEEALTWLHEFDPDLLIVSAGYDALDADELATASLKPEDYGRMGKRLEQVFGRKVAFGLEGGYNLQVTPKAIRETLEPFLLNAPAAVAPV